MKCRNIVKQENGKQNIVWFGSTGKDTYYAEHLENTDVRYIRILVPKSKFIFNLDGSITITIEMYADQQPNAASYGTMEINYWLYVNGEAIRHVSTNYLFIPKGKTMQLTYTIPASYAQDEYDSIEIRMGRASGPTYMTLTYHSLKANKAENYATEQHGVAASLIQRLSVIKGELWYKASYGLPLMDKIKNKGIYDSIIINIINSHPDVKTITYFESKVENHNYIFRFIVNTIYSEEVEINYIL